MKVAVGFRRVAAGKRTSGRCPTQIAAQFFAEGEEAQLTEEQQKLFSKWSTLTDRQKEGVKFSVSMGKILL